MFSQWVMKLIGRNALTCTECQSNSTKRIVQLEFTAQPKQNADPMTLLLSIALRHKTLKITKDLQFDQMLGMYHCFPGLNLWDWKIGWKRTVFGAQKKYHNISQLSWLVKLHPAILAPGGKRCAKHVLHLGIACTVELHDIHCLSLI